jgi:hypothetical protein
MWNANAQPPQVLGFEAGHYGGVVSNPDAGVMIWLRALEPSPSR